MPVSSFRCDSTAEAINLVDEIRIGDIRMTIGPAIAK